MCETAEPKIDTLPNAKIGISMDFWKIVRYGFLFVIYLVSYLFPRTDTWVMTAGDGMEFKGNTKYLFLYMENHNVSEQAVWITRNHELNQKLNQQGFQSYYYPSFGAIYHSLRAERAFITHILGSLPWWCLASANVVNLWHGVPLKQIEWDTDEHHNLNILHKLAYSYLFGRLDQICITSDHLKPIFESAFQLPSEKIQPTGYPRNDVLHRPVEGALIDNVELSSDSKFLFAYIPTWRRDQKSPLSNWGISLSDMNDLLIQMNARLIIKLHPFSEPKSEYRTHSQIDIVTRTGDVYPSLTEVDCLITDYSSIYFDYLHIDNPIIFYPYDFDTYINNRGFYFEYEDAVPGPVADSDSDLFNEMRCIARGVDQYSTDRQRTLHRFFDHVDGKSARRVHEKFCNKFVSDTERTN